MSTSVIPRKPPQENVSFELDSEAGAPLYQQVQTLIRRHIAEGRLQPGDRLPALLRLSDEMGIAYATVARGVRGLVECGVLEAQASRGTLVADTSRQRSHRTGIIGTLDFGRLLRETRYYRAMLFQVQEALIENKQMVVYNRWDEQESLKTLIDRMRPLDCLIFFNAPPERLAELQSAQADGMPLICIGDTFNDPQVPAVHTTNRQDAQRITQILRRRGHDNIAAALTRSAAKETLTVQERLSGFRLAMRDAPPSAQLYLDSSPDEWAKQLLAMKEPPSAILLLNGAANYRSLHDALKGTPLELGKKIDLAVWDETLWHTITPYGIPFLSVEQSLRQIADIAVAETLRMQEKPSYRSGLVQVASQIIEVGADGSRTTL